MTERSPIPDCLSHLRQMLPVRTSKDDALIKEMRALFEYGVSEQDISILVDGADRLEELLPDDW